MMELADYDPSTVELPPELEWARHEYVAIRMLPDGRYCGVHRLLYHWTVHIGLNETGYDDRYCYEFREWALVSMIAWDGEGDPILWHKHPMTNRLRDPLTGSPLETLGEQRDYGAASKQRSGTGAGVEWLAIAAEALEGRRTGRRQAGPSGLPADGIRTSTADGSKVESSLPDADPAANRLVRAAPAVRVSAWNRVSARGSC